MNRRPDHHGDLSKPKRYHWYAFHDYGAAMNWVEDTLDAASSSKGLTQVKESDMDAYPDLEWPFEHQVLILWMGDFPRPTQRQLLEEVISSVGRAYRVHGQKQIGGGQS